MDDWVLDFTIDRLLERWGLNLSGIIILFTSNIWWRLPLVQWIGIKNIIKKIKVYERILAKFNRTLKGNIEWWIEHFIDICNDEKMTIKLNFYPLLWNLDFIYC